MSAVDESPASLGPDAIHNLLSNTRRRLAYRLLVEADGPLSIRDLSEEIAAIETGERPAPRDTRHAVYVSLQQNHVPKMTEHDVVVLDEGASEVRLGPRAEDLRAYVAAVRDRGVSWPESYLLVSTVGLAAFLIAALGSAAADPPMYVAGASLLCVGGMATYHTVQQERTGTRRENAL